MKESKTSENINKDELVENTEKKFEEDLNEIKEKLNAEKLSDEFKENLQAKLEKELNGTPSNDNGKIIKFPVITRKLAGICACFVFLCTSCIAFADEIENVIFNIFSNTDKIVERAIANGNYREIDMDYVEDNGISIKVDYIVAEDDNLYIAFNVLSEKEFDNLFFENAAIKVNDIVVHKYNLKEDEYINRYCKVYKSAIYNNNIIYIYQILAKDINEDDKIKISIKDLQISIKDELKTIYGNWEYEI